jgi:preprotein translocase subunit SecA
MRVKQELAAIADETEHKAREEAIRAEVADFKERALKAGGLYIIGTERHESRRIDNQLRGRSGRQGDPGRSKFFLSTQDDLMRIFGGERMENMLTKLGLKDDESIVHSWVNKALEKSQQKVEARNFDIRKNILKYDDVMNAQRKVVFERRRELMNQDSVEETISEMRHAVVEDIVGARIPKDAYAEQWDVAGLKQDVERSLNLDLPIEEWAKEEGIADEEIEQRIVKAADESYAARCERLGPEVMRSVEKQVVLQAIDHLWQEHLVVLDHLRQVIGFRGYAQRDPLNEYKSEAFELFQGMMSKWDDLTTSHLNRVELQQGGPPQGDVDYDPLQGLTPEQIAEINAAIESGEFSPERLAAMGLPGFAALPAEAQAPARDPADPSTWGHVSRNEPCPCGSGKKFKHCHGALA